MVKRFLLSLTTLLAVVILPASVYAASNQQGYNCPSQTSCPGTDHVTFNSFTNAPSYGGGDEHYFFRAKNANSPNPGFTNGKVDLNDDAILMQAYIHNDANPLNQTDSTAHNTQLTITLPSGFATTQTVTAQVSASNANPQTVSDTITITDQQPFSLSFDTGYVTLTQRTNNGNGDFAITNASNYSISGNTMTFNFGDWAGGFKNHGLVTVRAKVSRQEAQQTSLVCNNLTVNPIDHNRATVTTTSGVKNANISSYSYTVKNSSGTVVDSSTVNTNAQTSTYNFNQSTPGTYTVTSVINTDKGSTSVSSQCTQQITVQSQATTLSASTQTTTPAPTQATTLPNTGAGDVVGLFAGASAAGTAGHMIVTRLRRRP